MHLLQPVKAGPTRRRSSHALQSSLRLLVVDAASAAPAGCLRKRLSNRLLQRVCEPRAELEGVLLAAERGIIQEIIQGGKVEA
jgi:hypothetical protein